MKNRIKSIKHYPYGILKGKVIMAGLHDFPSYWRYRENLPQEEKFRWPTNPGKAYEKYSFEDFFGCARHSSKRKLMCSWEEFLEGVNHFKIHGYDEYEKNLGKLSAMFGKKFPRSPRRAFHQAQKAKYVFLRESKFHSYQELKQIIRLVGIKGTVGYRKYRDSLAPKKREKFPSSLKEAYPEEYSPKDFFVSEHYSLAELSIKVRQAKIDTWAKYIKHRKTLTEKERRKWPRHPRLFYKNFDRRTFYIQLKKPRKFYPLLELSVKVKAEKLRNLGDYRRFHSSIEDLEEKKRWPAKPDVVYKNFKYHDFFGVCSWTGRFCSYEMLRKRVQKLRLRNMEEYLAYRKKIADPAEKMRWPSVLSKAYPHYSPNDFFYKKRASLTFAEAVIFLEKEKALYPTDCLPLREKESRLPRHPLIIWSKECKSADALFRFRSSGQLIKIGNLFFYNLEIFRDFLRDNAIDTKKEYLGTRNGLPEFEKRLYPADPKTMYLRFYGKQGINGEMHFYSSIDFTDGIVRLAMAFAGSKAKKK